MRRLVIAATVLVCLVGGSQARAAAPRAFYGVIAATDPDFGEIARMGAGKVGTLRINFVWGAVQPSAGAPYDWSHYDALIGAAAQQGIRVLPTVYSSPSWVAPRPNYPPPEDRFGDFRAFVHAAAERYGSHGTFWAVNPAVPKLPIINWQLWNEVNSPTFWYQEPKAKQYAALLRVFSDGIRSADPAAQIVLAGLFTNPRIEHGITLKRYLPALYRAKTRSAFDAVDVHPYSTTPKQALRAVRDTRKIMSRFKDENARLWVTEIGWASAGIPTPLTVSPQRQATYLRRIFSLLASNRRRLRLAGVIWYSWRDLPSATWVDNTGLFTVDLTPKPAWSAFTALTGGSPA
jgi:hypothetical protein